MPSFTCRKKKAWIMQFLNEENQAGNCNNYLYQFYTLGNLDIKVLMYGWIMFPISRCNQDKYM